MNRGRLRRCRIIAKTHQYRLPRARLFPRRGLCLDWQKHTPSGKQTTPRTLEMMHVVPFVYVVTFQFVEFRAVKYLISPIYNSGPGWAPIRVFTLPEIQLSLLKLFLRISRFGGCVIECAQKGPKPIDQGGPFYYARIGRQDFELANGVADGARPMFNIVKSVNCESGWVSNTLVDIMNTRPYCWHYWWSCIDVTS